MQKVAIESIRIGERKVALSEANVAQLMESIQAIGLLQPIGVRPDGTLVYGYHRLEACRRLGWTEIPAVVVENNDLVAELAELDENLVRNTFEDKILLGELLLQRKQLYEQLHPEARSEIVRIQKVMRNLKPFQNTDNANASDEDTVSASERLLSIPETPTFVQDTAKKIGVSERSVRRTIQIAEQIVPEARDLLRGTPIACSTTELLQLARLEPETQPRVAEVLVDGAAKTVKDAVRHIKRREVELQAVSDAELPPTIQLRVGDFREVLSDLPPSSVDAIITDPPYPAEHVPLFDDLGALAARVLKPHGVLVVMTGQLYLYDYMTLLNRHLRYRWICAYHASEAKPTVYAARFAQAWKPLLVYVRHDAQNLRFVPSDYFGAALGKLDGVQKTLHHWQQSLAGFTEIVQRFTEPGETVLDPFLGSGTTALACLHLQRRFIGCDIDASAVAIARQRVQEVCK